ncbi:MAG TPA: glycosyltransferase family 4 protein [bacterium]|nr:glycosyltransferase family 4 protein [bacterium]HOL93069.1 glycosyltransferase family 4 protein [bacterium]HPP02232.1 glycosyltransferase family 4 protein [bacterium]
MKILFVTPVVPTETDGRRPFNFLKYLAPRHEIHLIALKLPVQTPMDIRRLQGMGVRVTTVDIVPVWSVLYCAAGVVARKPFRVSWCRAAEMRETIERVLSRHTFDVAHLDRLRMGQYAPWIPIPKLVDITDSLLLYLERSAPYRRKKLERLVDYWEMKTIPRFERWVLERVNTALVCSSIDAKHLQQAHPGYPFDVIENSVDSAQFVPQSHATGHRPRCILTGTLFYFGNIDSVLYYYDEILPRLRQDIPQLETHIIGTRPVREIQKLHNRQGIQIIADVPRMQDYLFQDDIYLCPLRVAAGVRNKLLEAMACAMPVVTTRLGAEGLDVQHGREVLFAETPDEFSHCVQKLMASPELRKQLGQNGRQYVLTHHQNEILGKKLEALYQRLIQAGRPGMAKEANVSSSSRPNPV